MSVKISFQFLSWVFCRYKNITKTVFDQEEIDLKCTGGVEGGVNGGWLAAMTVCVCGAVVCAVL